MADEPGNDTADPGDTENPDGAAEAAPHQDSAAAAAGPSEAETAEAGTVTTVVVRSAGELAAPGWRGRAVALRSALPQLARHPVVVGASAAAATIAVRVAVDLARQALGAQVAPRSSTLEVTGRVVHDVHVVRHVHVFHHYPVPVSWWPPPPPPH